jgi:hypothetical protein
VKQRVCRREIIAIMDETARHARQSPGAMTLGGPGEPTRQSLVTSRQRKVVMIVIGLVAAARLPLDRRFQRRVIMIVIGLAAAAGLARNGQAVSLARLAAWDKQQQLRNLVRNEGRPHARRPPAS